MYDPIITAVKGNDDSMKIALNTEMPGLILYYTFDGTDPDNFYPKYSGAPLDIPIGASETSVVAYRHGRAISRQVNHSLEDMRQNFS